MQEGLGGVEQYVLNLSKYCDEPHQKYGYIIIGEKTIYEDELKKLGVDYFFVTHKNKNVFRNVLELNKLFKEKRDMYDTIYFNTSGLYYPIPYILAKHYKYKIALHSHLTNGAWPKRLIHYFNRVWISKLANVRMACSTPAGEWLFGKKDFKLIPNAIQIERFRFSQNSRNEIFKKFNLDGKFVIGHIGRLTAIKNQRFLLEIFECYHALYSDSVLMVVGDGEDRKMLETLVQEKKLEESVIFVGRTEEPEYYMSAMDCFVLPSITEGFPITLVEAQANGLPCVVSDSITREVNISGNISFVSINSEASVWVDYIRNNKERYSSIEKLQSEGYDVNNLEERVYRLIKQ